MRRTGVTLACLLALAGCGSHQPPSAAQPKSVVTKALAGSPPQLASLHKQANQLLFGGKSAFQARLAALRGHPVVVNKWASWCAPCRGEFPVFQKAGVKLGRQVAFLGLDGNDNNGDARKFLAQYPVTYPSYSDPSVSLASSIKAAGPFPMTVFIDKQGKVQYVHAGPYSKVTDLTVDIRRYAG